MKQSSRKLANNHDAAGGSGTGNRRWSGLAANSSDENPTRRSLVSIAVAGNGTARKRRAEEPQSSRAPVPGGYRGLPVWFAALIASNCKVSASGGPSAVRWECVGERALYTNHDSETSRIEPLGISLESGYTLSVGWMPNRTTYTLDVFQQQERCA